MAAEIYKVKANVELFNANRSIRSKLQNLTFLINGDGTVSREQLEQGQQQMNEVYADLRVWWEVLIKHVEDCNP